MNGAMDSRGGFAVPSCEESFGSSPDTMSSTAALLPVPRSETSTTLPERLIARRGMVASGPLVVCIGSVHGNEPAGVLACRRVIARIDADGIELAGSFAAIIGNRRASSLRQRYIDHDLNRIWVAERLAPLPTGGRLVEAEEAEELLAALELEAGDRRPESIHVVDLHTTSGASPAFAVLDDTLPNREFALSFPVPLVLGLEEELSGTMLAYLTERDWITMGFESGQHDDPASVDRAEAAVWLALAAAGLLAADHPAVTGARLQLEQASQGFPHVLELRYRHAITPEAGFRMMPGFVSFDSVEAGAVLGHDRSGEVRATESGRVLMPLYQAQGDDGFFLVRRVSERWLELSKWLRNRGVDRIVHWLPGVRRHPDQAESWIVDRRVARWFASDLFHLLGFRHRGRAGRFVVVTRRV